MSTDWSVILPQAVRLAFVLGSASMAGRYGLVLRQYVRGGNGSRTSPLAFSTGFLVLSCGQATIALASRRPWSGGTSVYLAEIGLLIFGHLTIPSAQDLARKESYDQ